MRMTVSLQQTRMRTMVSVRSWSESTSSMEHTAEMHDPDSGTTKSQQAKQARGP